jgi:hypothetical protein
MSNPNNEHVNGRKPMLANNLLAMIYDADLLREDERYAMLMTNKEVSFLKPDPDRLVSEAVQAVSEASNFDYKTVSVYRKDLPLVFNKEHVIEEVKRLQVLGDFLAIDDNIDLFVNPDSLKGIDRLADSDVVVDLNGSVYVINDKELKKYDSILSASFFVAPDFTLSLKESAAYKQDSDENKTSTPGINAKFVASIILDDGEALITMKNGNTFEYEYEENQMYINGVSQLEKDQSESLAAK